MASLNHPDYATATSSYTRMSSSIFLPSLLPRNLFHRDHLAPQKCTSKPYHEGYHRKYSYGAKPARPGSGYYIKARPAHRPSSLFPTLNLGRRSVPVTTPFEWPAISSSTSIYRPQTPDQDFNRILQRTTNPHTRRSWRLYRVHSYSLNIYILLVPCCLHL